MPAAGLIKKDLEICRILAGWIAVLKLLTTTGQQRTKSHSVSGATLHNGQISGRGVRGGRDSNWASVMSFSTLQTQTQCRSIYTVLLFLFFLIVFLLLQGTESCRRKSYSAWMRSNSDGRMGAALRQMTTQANATPCALCSGKFSDQANEQTDVYCKLCLPKR